MQSEPLKHKGEKKVDERWKETIEEGRAKAKTEAPSLEADFRFFVSSLGMQALMALGEVENPVTKKAESDLNQARYIIDTINMLKEKTKGNLTEDEARMLDSMMYELQMKYAAQAK